MKVFQTPVCWLLGLCRQRQTVTIGLCVMECRRLVRGPAAERWCYCLRHAVIENRVVSGLTVGMQQMFRLARQCTRRPSHTKANSKVDFKPCSGIYLGCSPLWNGPVKCSFSHFCDTFRAKDPSARLYPACRTAFQLYQREEGGLWHLWVFVVSLRLWPIYAAP